MYIIIPLCSFYGGLELNGLPGDNVSYNGLPGDNVSYNGLPGDNVSYNGLPGDNVGCLGKGGRGGEHCLSSYLYVPSMMDWS